MPDAMPPEETHRATPAPLLQMDHLKELRAEIEATQRAVREAPLSTEPPPAAVVDDPREKNRYSFDFEFKGPRGVITRGRFTNKILSIGEKISVGTMRARLQMGVSLDAMDVETYNMLFRVTWLQQSLVEKPKWAEDLLALESEVLVAELFKKVDSHERYFRGEEPSAQGSQAQV